MRLARRARLLVLWALLVTTLVYAPGARAAGSLAATYATTPLAAVSGAAVGLTGLVEGSASTTTVPSSVGALFSTSSASHSCTASVVESPKGNVIVTAAHCVSGSGVGMRFAPGYANGSAPYGYWTVTGAYAPTGWLTSQSVSSDMVVLTVAPTTIDGVSRSLQSVVGALAVGTTAAAGTEVTVAGYAAGSGDSAIICSTATTTTSGSGGPYPSFTCGSFPSGTSGSPWIATVNGRATLVGVIGGLHQGGCTEATSYSSPIGTTLAQLVERSANSMGDTVPSAGSSGC